MLIWERVEKDFIAQTTLILRNATLYIIQSKYTNQGGKIKENSKLHFQS